MKETIRIIHQAIDAERESITTYLNLAKAVSDPKAKNVLIHLASDEVGHMAKLETHMIAVLRLEPGVLERGGLIEAMSSRLSAPALVPQPKNFAKADVVGVLEVALDREIAASKRYADMAASPKSSPEAKGMFLALAAEEDNHRRIIQGEIDAIGQSGFWLDFQEFSMEK